MRYKAGFSTALLAAGLLAGSAAAQSPSAIESFYRGKVVTLVISTGPGEGVDTNARMVARHLGNHIPGKPSIVPKNMPGAGHVLAANHLANEAPQDGTVLLSTLGAILSHQLLDGRGMRYDTAKFNWIGASDVSNQNLYIWHTAGIRTLEDAMKKEVVMGATGAGSYTILYPTLMNHLVGTKFKIVAGYQNTNQIHLAMERGEVQGRAGNLFSSLKAVSSDWLRDKKIDILFQVGLEKEPDFPEVPLMRDFAKSEDDRKVMDLFATEVSMGRPTLTGPGVPAERVAALRQAFAATMKDPGLLADAAKAGLTIAPLTGERLQEIVTKAVATPPDLIEKAKQAMKEDAVTTKSN